MNNQSDMHGNVGEDKDVDVESFPVPPPESTVSMLMHLCLQELQFALSERVCTATKQLPPGTNKQGLSTNGAANTPPEGNKTTDRPEVKIDLVKYCSNCNTTC